MGLIGKIALIGIVAIAVLIAVIWDVRNEEKVEAPKTTNGDQIADKVPDNFVREETPNPETPQEETAAIEQPEISEQPQKNQDTQPEGENDVEIPELPETPETPETPSDVKQPVEEPHEATPVVSGTGSTYIIQPRDTMFKIAQKFYGNGKLWPAIAAANTGTIEDPEVLKVGTEITIPPREEVLGEESLPALPQSQETYIIQAGDNLTKISRMHYGSDKYAELIFRANLDKINDKNVLTPGTIIVIPPMPEEDGE